jgi:hypothetical protein
MQGAIRGQEALINGWHATCSRKRRGCAMHVKFAGFCILLWGLASLGLFLCKAFLALGPGDVAFDCLARLWVVGLATYLWMGFLQLLDSESLEVSG